MWNRVEKWSREWSAVALAVVLACLALAFGAILNSHRPIANWLFPRYLTYCVASAMPLAASALAGSAIVSRIAPRAWTTPEVTLLGSAVGLFGFQFGWSLLGFLHLYSPVTAVAWPVLFGGVGAWCLRKRLARLPRLVRRIRALRRGLTLGEALTAAVGIFGMGLVYAAIMTPNNIAFDARWYHLPIAERYAVEGGIVPFREGWLVGAYPQLASTLYSWCFSLPWTSTFDRVELAAHLEFEIFVATAAGIPVLVRRLLPPRVAGPRFAWASVFLFPELFVYDSSVNGGADHIAGFWAIPLFLALLLSWKRLQPSALGIFAVLASGAVMTKLTASGLVLGPVVALLVRFVWLSIKERKKRDSSLWRSRLVALLALPVFVLALTSPYWLKNWIWYHDPVFPLAADFFGARPWNSEAAFRMASMVDGTWYPSRDWKGARETLEQAVLFSFKPSDWASFHRDLPMFGSLFTLLAPVLIFRRTRALIGLYGIANFGVLYWFFTFHQDRYLQAYLPWMAAAVVATIALAWDAGKWIRLPLLALVGLQLVWGGDAPFFGTHVLAGQPLKATLDFLSAGYAGKRSQKLVAYAPQESIHEALPPGARLLRHEIQIHLGVGAPTVSDWFQTGISYSHKPGPKGVHEVLRSYGVTHMMWHTTHSLAFDSLGSDLAFFNYALRVGLRPSQHCEYSLAELPKNAPEKSTLSVAYFGCDPKYARGLYDVSRMTQMPNHGRWFEKTTFPSPLERLDEVDPRAAQDLLRRADTAVTNDSCKGAAPRPKSHGFVLAARRGEDVLWVRSGREGEK